MYLIMCVANVCLNDQVPLDCLAEDPSDTSMARTDDAVFRCAKCRSLLQVGVSIKMNK